MIGPVVPPQVSEVADTAAGGLQDRAAPAINTSVGGCWAQRSSSCALVAGAPARAMSHGLVLALMNDRGRNGNASQPASAIETTTRRTAAIRPTPPAPTGPGGPPGIAWVSCQALERPRPAADADLVRGEGHVRTAHARQGRRRRAAASPSTGSAPPRSGRRATLLARDRADARRLGGEPQLGDLDEPLDGSGIGPKRSVTSCRNAAMSPACGHAPAAGTAPASGPRRARSRRAGGRRPAGRRRPAGLDDRCAALAEGLLLLDRLGEHPRVQVEADRGHVPRLLAAEDVAGAADLEVGQRDLEPGAELGGVEDRLEPLARLVRQPLAAPVQQVGVRPPRRPADPPASW